MIKIHFFPFTFKLPTGPNFHSSYISLVMLCVMIQTFLTWVLVVEYIYFWWQLINHNHALGKYHRGSNKN